MWKGNRYSTASPSRVPKKESNMQLRAITTNDIPTWESLSSEYDCYVQELVEDFTEWYDGNDEDSLAFTTYMEDKISEQEAYMVVNAANSCLGIVAFSKHNNPSHSLGFLTMLILLRSVIF